MKNLIATVLGILIALLFGPVLCYVCGWRLGFAAYVWRKPWHCSYKRPEYALWYDALYARGFADDLWNARSAVEFLRRQRKQEQQIK